ncbi:MAG TPA: sulfite exporter TauE/SafE family protein [Actinomycetota bacterium]|nr:sulfite exporter TauE/SafE family protein [Actinomycetota bacterium]
MAGPGRMQIDAYVALAALIVGFTVGLTGMGGGALMTPILVLLFKVQPLAAVSSDLVASMIMKPIGSSVHIRRGPVRWELVRWLALGSVPSAFAGVFILRSLGDNQHVQDNIKILLGATLMLAATAMVLKAWLQGRQSLRLREEGLALTKQLGPVNVKKFSTLLVGMIGGLLVGMTSVGSGSVIIVCMLLMYPNLRSAHLVGTDLAQAVPLVGSAAIAHILFGQFELSLTSSVLIGAIPGVYIGARMSSKAPDGVIRPALVYVLLASGLKLVNVPTETLGYVMLGVALVGLPLWGAIDALAHPQRDWTSAGLDRRRWIGLQAAGAPFGVGFAAAVAYFAKARPQLEAATAKADRAA